MTLTPSIATNRTCPKGDPRRRPELQPSLQPGRPTAVLVRNGEMSAQAEGDTESDAGGSGRRGVAGSLAALLTRSAHGSGAMLVFLDVEGPREEVVYLRAGFTRAGERVWITKRSIDSRRSPWLRSA